MSTPARLLLADDHALVRRGVRLILDAEPDLTVVAEAADGAEAVELLREVEVDLVVLDVAMPRLTGLQAARQISAIVSRTISFMEAYYRFMDKQKFCISCSIL